MVNIAEVPLGSVYVYEPSVDILKLLLSVVPLNTAVTCSPSLLVQFFNWRPLDTAAGAVIEPVPRADPYTSMSPMDHQKPEAAVLTTRMCCAVRVGNVTAILPMPPLPLAIALPQSAPSSET